VLAVIVAAALIIVLMVHSANASDVRHSAGAAEKAGTFTFASSSILTFANGTRETARESGAVDLSVPGYRVQITTSARATGFERIVFPHTLYVRPIGASHPGPWREITLEPPVAIAAKVGGSAGISDPLGLLAVLRQSHGAQKIGEATIGRIETTHFRLQTTLGPFLRDEGVTAPARVASDPVTVDVWLDSASRVIRARRLFELGAPRGARLLVATEFTGYGADVRLRPPPAPIRTGVPERLNPVAADPLSASVLGALLNGSRHPATPTIERSAP